MTPRMQGVPNPPMNADAQAAGFGPLLERRLWASRWAPQERHHPAAFSHRLFAAGGIIGSVAANRRMPQVALAVFSQSEEIMMGHVQSSQRNGRYLGYALLSLLLV